MFYSVKINVPNQEPITVEAVGEFRLRDEMNKVLSSLGLPLVSRMDLSRILCNSKDKSKRLEEFENMIEITKKRTQTVLIKENPNVHIIQKKVSL